MRRAIRRKVTPRRVARGDHPHSARPKAVTLPAAAMVHAANTETAPQVAFSTRRAKGTRGVLPALPAPIDNIFADTAAAC